MYFLVTIKNTGDYEEYMRAVDNFLNGYEVHESYVGVDHAHILIKTNIMPDVQYYHRYYKCYIHFRRVRDFFADVERVKEYIRKHKEKEVSESMDCGNVKVWVKRRDDGKVILTIQAPKWYDLSNKRIVITWTDKEFKEFVKYLVLETGLVKGKSKTVKGKKTRNGIERVKGFSKAVKG